MVFEWFWIKLCVLKNVVVIKKEDLYLRVKMWCFSLNENWK